MRSEGNDAVVDCEDPMTVIACTTDTDACPAKCRESNEPDEDVVVKSGDLDVTATAAAGRSVIKGGVNDLDTLTFKTSEDVTITRVVLERYGYSSANDVASVWLEDEDGNVISNKTTGLNNKGQAKLTIDKDYRSVDGKYNATIVLETKKTAEGSTIGFKVVDVESTAENVNLKDYNPATYDIVNYNGTEVTFTVRGGSKDYNYEEGKSYEVAKFKVKAADDSAVLVNGFTLTDTKGEFDLEDVIDSVVVTVNDKEVKGTKFSIDDEKLTISFDKVEIAAKESATFAVEVELSNIDKYGQTLAFAVKAIEDFKATEKKTGARVTEQLDENEDSSFPLAMSTYTFNGGKARLTSEKLGAIDAAIDATDIVIAKGEIQIPEAIEGNSLKITASMAEGKDVADIIDRLVLEIAGDEYEGTLGDDGVFTFGKVEIEESGKVRVLIDTKNNKDYEGESITFSFEGLDEFTYSDDDGSDTIDVAGSLNISKVTIQGVKASLKNELDDGVEYKLNEVNKHTIFNGTFTAKKSDVALQNFIVEANKEFNLVNGTKTNKITFYLSINGEEVADEKASSTGYAADDYADVLVKAGQSVSVKLEAEVDAKWANENGELELGDFKLTLGGVDVNDYDITPVSRNTVELTIVKAGTPDIDDSAEVTDTVLLRAKNQTIAQFILKSSNSSDVDLETISFNISNVADPDNDVVLYVDGVEEDIECSDAGVCEAEGLTNVLDEEGLVVKVDLSDEVAAGENGLTKVVLDNLVVNETAFEGSTFTVAFADAILTLSQKDMGAYTKFTVESLKKYKSSTKVENLVLNGHNSEGSAATPAKCAALPDGAAATDADKFNAPEAAADCAYTLASTTTFHAATTEPEAAAYCEDAPEGATLGSKFNAPEAAADCAYTLAGQTDYTAAAEETAVDFWGIKGTVSVGKSFEVNNTKDTTVSIDTMSYDVDSKTVTVSRSEYEDYFKTAAGENYRVFPN